MLIHNRAHVLHICRLPIYAYIGIGVFAVQLAFALFWPKEQKTVRNRNGQQKLVMAPKHPKAVCLIMCGQMCAGSIPAVWTGRAQQGGIVGEIGVPNTFGARVAREEWGG